MVMLMNANNTQVLVVSIRRHATAHIEKLHNTTLAVVERIDDAHVEQCRRILSVRSRRECYIT